MVAQGSAAEDLRPGDVAHSDMRHNTLSSSPDAGQVIRRRYQMAALMAFERHLSSAASKPAQGRQAVNTKGRAIRPAAVWNVQGAPAGRLGAEDRVVIVVQPQQPVQQLVEVHLPVVRDLRHLPKLEAQALQDLR